MPIRITNTLTGKKEPLETLKPNEIRMYTCGPTVYGLTHIGNARPAVFFDVARRFFEKSGYLVTWVMNFTDVDDKIIHRAREEGKSAAEIAEYFAAEYLKDLAALGVRRPNHQPKVTETIPQIIELIEGLIKNQAAYVAEDGEVFFSIRSFPSYGKLSGKKIDELRIGVRIQADEKKRDPLDFTLWKPRKSADEPAWSSPWGKGRPGWHIECSAMAKLYLGETFDIHGGGLDLIHPHHENEIAQSEACSGKVFARVWMHNNLISMNKEKMSKSLGNIFLTRDFIRKYTAETLRYLLLSVHYRSPAEFSETHIREIQAALHRVYSAKKKAVALSGVSTDRNEGGSAEEKALAESAERLAPTWNEALSDDFNTPKVVAAIFDYVRAFNAYVDKKGFKPSLQSVKAAKTFLENLENLSQVLNLFGEEAVPFLESLRKTILEDRGLDAQQIQALVDRRKKAREEKNFTESDAIRDELLKKRIEIKDTPQGTEWDVLFQ
jgi:cysteinyl-tRNA synthetase